ncbi:hypothetical protein PMIN03_013123 [Paraphaeosphaeria minitans]
MKLTILASVAVVASTITAMPSAPLDPRAEKCTTQCCAKWRNICLLGCGGGPEHALCVSNCAPFGAMSCNCKNVDGMCKDTN